MNETLRDDAPDAVFHVTTRVNWRFWHLEPQATANEFLEILEESMAAFGMDTLGFVLMSNHCHLVPRSPPEDVFLELTRRRTRCRHRRPWPQGHWKASALSQFMQRLLYRSSRSIQKKLGLSGRFWEKRFHARRVEDEVDLLRTLTYDHLNPVVQKMVLRPEDYARSSASWWSGTGTAPVPLVKRPLPFSLDLDSFRQRLLQNQRDHTFIRAVEALCAEGLDFDSEEGRSRLEELLGGDA